MANVVQHTDMSSPQPFLNGHQRITPPSSFVDAPLTPPPTDEKASNQAPCIIEQSAKKKSGSSSFAVASSTELGNSLDKVVNPALRLVPDTYFETDVANRHIRTCSQHISSSRSGPEGTHQAMHSAGSSATRKANNSTETYCNHPRCGLVEAL